MRFVLIEPAAKLVACILFVATAQLGASNTFAARDGAYSVPAHLFSGELRGPYETGTFEELWVNDALDDPSTATLGDPRKLMVQVWYPATAPAHPRIAPYAISPQLYDDEHWVQHLGHVKTQSILDAPLVDSPQRLPVLIYNHGGIHPHFSATFQTEFLASHGYVVVAIGHSGANEIRRFPDGTSYRNDGAKWEGKAPTQERLTPREEWEYRMADADLGLFVQDISFVLDRLAERDADATDRFHGRLDLERVGSLGWSLGGFTSLQAAADEPRIKAAANLDGWPHGLIGPNGVVRRGSPRPVLLMSTARNGGATGLAGLFGHEVDAGEVELRLFVLMQYWEMLRRTTADWYYVTIDRISHGDFSDWPLLSQRDPQDLHPRAAHAIINAYVLEFFDKYVKGGSADTPLLSGKQTYPEVTLLRRKADLAKE